MKKLFLIIFLGSLLFVPLISLAGTYTACTAIDMGMCVGQIEVTYSGLVPCGGYVFDAYGNAWREHKCQLCHLFVMLDAIIDFALFRVLPPIAALMLVFGGVIFFATAENPQTVEKAKKLLISVGLGLVVIYGAWVIITLFFTSIGVMGLNIGIENPSHWANVNCLIIRK